MLDVVLSVALTPLDLRYKEGTMPSPNSAEKVRYRSSIPGRGKEAHSSATHAILRMPSFDRPPA